MAASISERAKPMLSMLAMAASRSPPIVRAEGSLKRSPDAWTGAGEGVPGTFCEFDEGAGAAGAAGVWAGAGAGVEGAALLDDAAAALGLETMQTMNPFSSMLYDSTVFASCRILPIIRISDCGRHIAWEGARQAYRSRSASAEELPSPSPPGSST
jgi:hypothetical protein